MFIFTLLLWAAFFLLSEVLRPKPKTEAARPSHLGDFSFPTATEGRSVPLVWGTIKIEGPNVVWYGDLHHRAITKKVKSGLFSSSKVTTGYRYKLGIQFALCRGEVDMLEKIWVGDKLLWEGELATSSIQISKRNFFGGDEMGNGGIAGKFSFYTGSRTQTPNSYLAQTPADFLWQDVFSKGHSGDVISQYKGSSAHHYYQVSNKGQTSDWGPGSGKTNSSTMATISGTSSVVHIRSSYVGGATGDLNRYNALLMHPDRPRLNDQILIAMSFKAKDSTAVDFTSSEMWMGCKCQDTTTVTDQFGVFVVVKNQSRIELFVCSSTSGGMHQIVGLDAPTDFPLMTGTHTVELHVQGDTLTLLLDGVQKYTGTFSPVLTIPLDDHQGFCLGIGGNLNQDFGSGNDWTDVGIFSFSIDSLVRARTSNQPAYRGTSYGVLERGYIGNSTNIDPWAFQIRRVDTCNFLGLDDDVAEVNNGDANPMNALYEILTDPDWGLGFSAGDIDIDNFVAAAITLASEGNGWTFLLDNTIECGDLIREIERQTDGYTYVDRTTGKWKMSLARSGYVVADLPLIDESNTIEVKDFTRGAWEETSNSVQVEFSNRSNNFGTTYALGQDSANIRIQGGTVVSVQSKYPGVKDRALANQIAWRDLRAQAYPLAKVKIAVDRSFYDSNPGDLFRWTNTARNIIQLPMRVTRVDLGSLEDGTIVIDAVQDVFGYELPSFAAPDNTQWLDPTDVSPTNIDLADRLVFEAPRALCRLAEEAPGVIDRVWVGARTIADAGRAELWAASGVADFSQVGEIQDFLVAGSLDSALEITAQGTTVEVTGTPDDLADITDALVAHTAYDLGQLFNVVLIDDEFIAFETFTDNGSSITLNNVYRGLMDSVPASHSSGTRVWFLTGNVTDTAFAAGLVASVRILPENQKGTLDLGIATASTVTMSNRARKPLPPANLLVNDSPFPPATTMDSYALGSLNQIYGYTAPTGMNYANYPDTSNQEVGQRFTPSVSGYVLGIRFYKANSTSGSSHTAHLWTESGSLLATATFADETSSGWQVVYFDAPVAVTAANDYIASVQYPVGEYARGSTLMQFTHTFGNLVTPSDGGAIADSGGTHPYRHSFDSFFVDPIYVARASLGLRGIALGFTRRDLRNTDEILALDEANLPLDFPTANATKYAAEVRSDPEGANTLLFTTPYNAGTNELLLERSKLLRYAGGIPSRLAVRVLTQHTYEGATFNADQALAWEFDASSPLTTGDTAWGNLAPSTASSSYVAANTATYTLRLEAALPSGAVEANVNGSGWSSVVAATLTSGTLALTAGDSVLVRHTQTGLASQESFLELIDGSTGLSVAWAICVEG